MITFDKMIAEVPDSTLDKYLENVGKAILEAGIDPDEVPECWVIWDTVEEEEIAWDESRAALENLLDTFEVRVWKDFPEMWNGPDEFRKRFIICKHPEV